MLVDDMRGWVTQVLQCFLDNAAETQFVILEDGDVTGPQARTPKF